MSTVYVQVHLPFTNILCLDMAIREAGGTWNAPEYIQELRQAKSMSQRRKEHKTSFLLTMPIPDCCNQSIVRLCQNQYRSISGVNT